MKSKQTNDCFPIPDEIFIRACNQTSLHFKKGVDSWGEEERCYCRRQCGDSYKHVESDLIGLRAINFRKSNKLDRIKNGKTKRKKTKPNGKYAKYLMSLHWRRFRLKVLQFWGFKCSVCSATSGLEVHHNTYERIGQELLQDCIVACRSCHEAIHFRMPEGNAEFETDSGNKPDGTEANNEILLF